MDLQRYIALGGGEGRNRRGWLYTRLYPRRQGALEHPYVRLHGRAFVRQTSTRRAIETFCWQAVFWGRSWRRFHAFVFSLSSALL